MDALIQQLRDLCYVFNPPSTNAQIQALETAINYPLDATMAALYRDHNGMLPDRSIPLRLMSVEEVVVLYRNLQGNDLYWMIPDTVRFFWADDHSNHAGLYISGPLSGKVCFFDHEDTELSPVFRSVQSFYKHLLYARDIYVWIEMPTDYPLLAASPEYDDADLALALGYIAQFEATADSEDWHASRERCFLGLIAMNLLPLSETERLLPFLSDSDMWIQAQACELLGKRRYEPAIPLLAEIAVNGTHNGRLAAIPALGDMRTPEAKAQLLRIAPRLKGAGKGNLSTLINYGCEFRRIGGEERFEYREAGSESWVEL